MPTALDLVTNVSEKKPSEFQANFSELVTDRIRDLIAGKRVEIAKNLFNPQAPVEVSAAPDETPDAETDTAETDAETDTTETEGGENDEKIA